MNVENYEIKKSPDKKFLFIDFEFNRTNHEFVNLVSASTTDRNLNVKNFWLHNDKEQKRKLIEYLRGFDVIVSYAAVAEARSFISLGLNPLDFKFIDLFFEYRCLANHNDAINYGDQLVDGVIKYIKKPSNKWDKKRKDAEDIRKGLKPEKEEGFKATHSLAEATFKLLGIARDTKEKDQVRDLILSDPEKFRAEEKSRILSYGEEDVKCLPDIYKIIKDNFLSLDQSTNEDILFQEMCNRGRYACHTAWMENHGYPIDVEKARNFSRNVPMILHEIQKDINSQFPGKYFFKWNKLTNKYSWDQKKTKEWIEENFKDKNWEKTDTGQYSLSLDAFTEFFSYTHDYPRGNFGAQIVRYLKLKQSLNGFMPPKKGGKNFWSSVGPDGRVRAYLNPFGAQSSRTQPSATSFLFLKAAWMRALCVPAKGKFMAGIDYGSQEFLIQALESGDRNMIEAYKSGDPYLYFGKSAGIIPPEGTKETHKFLRDCCKSSVLGMGYLMTKYGLAIKLTADTGKLWTEDEAQKQIDDFYRVFSDLKEYQNKIIYDYSDPSLPGFIKLYDGWYAWGDNPNPRSIANLPVQGAGSCIMRLAVDIAVSKGVKVIKTLHDAIYMEGDVGNEKQILILRDAMMEAFCHWYKHDKELYEGAKLMRLDPFAWSTSYQRDSELVIDGWKVPTSDLYIDERSLVDYEKFSPYFLSLDTDLL